MVRLPTWIVAPAMLIASAVRHPNAKQTMTIKDGSVEIALDDKGSVTTTVTRSRRA
jgi:hypothetical protein